MSKQVVIDSHVHLWPKETANEEAHAWMIPGMPLAKPHLIRDYTKASKQDVNENSNTKVEGIVYVETDVRYDTPNGDVAIWARGPLNEIKLLRSIVEGKYDSKDTQLLLGVVPWAPMDQPPSVLSEYLHLAEEIAARPTWSRVKGFRYLLQFIVHRDRFKALVLSDDFISNLKILGQRGFSFDIGVDQRSGGVWQLETVTQAMQAAHTDTSEGNKVTFVVNHLCKPDFSDQGAKFERWCKAISSMSKLSKTYMKLSGAFSELPPGLSEPVDVASHMKPWIAHVLKCFGPKRVMFGSDWPVCNVKGPLKDDSWTAWKDVVQLVLDDKTYELAETDKDCIWYSSAKEAYRLH